jgi:hypothetical protein
MQSVVSGLSDPRHTLIPTTAFELSAERYAAELSTGTYLPATADEAVEIGPSTRQEAVQEAEQPGTSSFNPKLPSTNRL